MSGEEPLSDLQVLCLGGEAIPYRIVEGWHGPGGQGGHGSRLLHSYGVTEATVYQIFQVLTLTLTLTLTLSLIGGDRLSNDPSL